MNKLKDKIPIYVSGGACLTPLGFDLPSNIKAIKDGKTALVKVQDDTIDDTAFVGGVIDQSALNQSFNQLQLKGEYSTLEKMMLLVVDKIKSKFSAAINDDCGLIISSTKGNINALEKEDINAYYLHQLAKKIGDALAINTEPIVLSNACVSGVMAISVAKSLIKIGKFKHAIVVGGDLFSRFVFSGFQSFQAVSGEPCKPYDKKRDGISLGEAAAAIFVTREKDMLSSSSCFEVIGDSSINDANHISGPSRTGEGLFQSIRNAMDEENIKPSEIDMISSHGTATMYNDEMEAQAFNRLKLEQTPTFSLKGYFGHTLGAAGLLETVIALAFAQENAIPVSIGYEEHGLTLPLNITTKPIEQPINLVLKTASGFGGSNTAVIFKKIEVDGE